jgi:hypothetical protein
MKDAFQKEHEGEDENDWTIGPKGNKVMTQEALQRKAVRDRAISEEVRFLLSSPSSFSLTLPSFFGNPFGNIQDVVLISRKQELEKRGWINSLKTSRTAWRSLRKQQGVRTIKQLLILSRLVPIPTFRVMLISSLKCD